MSIYKLTKDNNIINVVFNKNKCIFQDPHSKNLIGQGKEQVGLYIFQTKKDSRAY